MKKILNRNKRKNKPNYWKEVANVFYINAAFILLHDTPLHEIDA